MTSDVDHCIHIYFFWGDFCSDLFHIFKLACLFSYYWALRGFFLYISDRFCKYFCSVCGFSIIYIFFNIFSHSNGTLEEEKKLVNYKNSIMPLHGDAQPLLSRNLLFISLIKTLFSPQYYIWGISIYILLTTLIVSRWKMVSRKLHYLPRVT